jgi:hypothetical protein
MVSGPRGNRRWQSGSRRLDSREDPTISALDCGHCNFREKSRCRFAVGAVVVYHEFNLCLLSAVAFGNSRETARAAGLLSVWLVTTS